MTACRLKVAFPIQVLLLFGITVALYAPALDAPFIFDDWKNIVHNPGLDSLDQALSGPENRGRPLAGFSFYLNRKIGGSSPWSFHFLNLLAHLAAGLSLLGLCRRTHPLLKKPLPGPYSPDTLSLWITGIWLVHPLQTASVTVTVQRAEVLAGLCLLLALYLLARSASSARPRGWLMGAWLCCLLGFGCKQVMASAPFVLLLYDRTFLSGSFRGAFRGRPLFHLGTLATLGLIPLVFLFGAELRGALNHSKVSWFSYLLTQCEVILHYLRLSVWPYPQALDYGWPPVVSWRQVIPEGLGMIILLGACLWTLFYRPLLGFLGASFFLLLAPSSSFFPLDDPAFEHRMYLPLAPLVCLFVHFLNWPLAAGSSGVFGGTAGRPVLKGPPLPGSFSFPAGLLILGTLIPFMTLAFLRNWEYRSSVSIWASTVRARPLNTRAHINLGTELVFDGRMIEAAGAFSRAIELDPRSYPAFNHRANVLGILGRYPEALADHDRAIALEPSMADAFKNRAITLFRMGLRERAGQDLWACRARGGQVEPAFWEQVFPKGDRP